MVREVKITLKKLMEFLDNMKKGIIDNDALGDIKHVLEKSFKQNVLNQPHEGGVYEIPTKSDLEMLIQSAGGVSHKPSRIPRQAHYSKEYLRKKEMMNQGPHTYMNLGFVHGTEINKEGNRVVMRTDPASVTSLYTPKTLKGIEGPRPAAGFMYGVLHESKKSVLKATFYWAWEDIIKAIIEKYIDYLI